MPGIDRDLVLLHSADSPVAADGEAVLPFVSYESQREVCDTLPHTIAESAPPPRRPADCKMSTIWRAKITCETGDTKGKNRRVGRVLADGASGVGAVEVACAQSRLDGSACSW